MLYFEIVFVKSIYNLENNYCKMEMFNYFINKNNKSLLKILVIFYQIHQNVS